MIENMTNEQAKEFIVQSVKSDVDIAKVADAIQALEQQSTDAKTYLKRREENYVEYNVEWFLKNWELELEILSGGKIKPMDADCISKQAVLDVINFEDEWLYDAKSHNADTKIAFSTIKSKISKMSSVTPQQTRWIPVSERLPEREGWYLTSLGNKTYGGADVDMYCKGWVKYGTHVLAWMPLPEPYKESEDEE